LLGLLIVLFHKLAIILGVALLQLLVVEYLLLLVV